MTLRRADNCHECDTERHVRYHETATGLIIPLCGRCVDTLYGDDDFEDDEPIDIITDWRLQ